MLGKYEVYLIKVDGEFLVACPYFGSVLTRFSNSPYDGYGFQDFAVAIRIAMLFNGVVMKHNRINGDLTGGWS